MKNNRLLTITGTLTLLLSSFFTTQAQAHAHLKSAEPATESTVESAPGHLTLHFTEALEPTFSAAGVTDSQGKVVKTEEQDLLSIHRGAAVRKHNMCHSFSGVFIYMLCFTASA